MRVRNDADNQQTLQNRDVESVLICLLSAPGRTMRETLRATLEKWSDDPQSRLSLLTGVRGRLSDLLESEQNEGARLPLVAALWIVQNELGE